MTAAKKARRKAPPQGEPTNRREKPKKWQVEQWRSIVKDAEGAHHVLWKKIMASVDDDTRLMLLAYNLYDGVHKSLFPEVHRRDIDKNQKDYHAYSGFWSHEKVWKVTGDVEAALIGGPSPTSGKL